MARAQRSNSARHERMRSIFEAEVPFNRVLGLRVISFHAAVPKARFEMRPELVGDPRRGILHGGVISAALDVIAGFAVHLALIEKDPDAVIDFPRIGTVDLRVDYLRPGQGAYFVASARVLRLGRRIAATQMTLENDRGELIAMGAAAFAIG